MEQKEDYDQNGLIYKKEIRSDGVREIISSVPLWIIRWGITMIFIIFLSIILIAAFINYPDIVKTTLKINSVNSPKSVIAKQGGKLAALLVKDGEQVADNQPLAYFETTANPNDVLSLNKTLKSLQAEVLKQKKEPETHLPTNLDLGELQGSYQIFYQQYLQYQSTKQNGYYQNKIKFINMDLKSIASLRTKISNQENIRKLEYANQQEEYEAYKTLFKNKVISRSEFAQQENKFLASKYPLQETEISLLNNTNNYNAKEKELLDLKHIIAEEQARFIQALNKCITESNAWLFQNVLRAPVAGKVGFAGIVQQNQNVALNQEIFIVNPGNAEFFGEIQIPQYNMGKISLGNRTLVKLRSYPFEQYGMITARLTYISDAAYHDSVFIAKVIFEKIDKKKSLPKVVLKNGMLADAEIITEESSLLQRFFRNMKKMINKN